MMNHDAPGTDYGTLQWHWLLIHQNVGNPEIGFTEEDVENLRAFAPDALSFLPRVAERFYEVLLEDPAARAVFTGGTIGCWPGCCIIATGSRFPCLRWVLRRMRWCRC